MNDRLIEPTTNIHARPRWLTLLLDASFVVVLVSVLFAALMYAGLQLYGVRFYEVTSNSMSGSFDRGDVVAVRAFAAHDVEVGDVIAFTRPGFADPTVHRVEAISQPIPDVQTLIRDEDGNLLEEGWNYAHRDFLTRGDANPVRDSQAIPQEDVVGTLRFVVPPPFNLIVTKIDRQALMVIGVGSIILYIAWEAADGARALMRRRAARDAFE